MTPDDFKRWLYRGQQPNWIARILNAAWAAVASSGVASNYLVTLEMTGRKSGRTAESRNAKADSMPNGPCSEFGNCSWPG
jgi:hypothetical protein